MDEGKFWIAIWKLASTVTCVVALLVAVSSMHNDKLTSELIKQGKDPIAVKCAMSSPSSGEGRSVICAIKAMEK